MEKLIEGRRHIFGNIFAPGIAVNHLACGIAFGINLEKYGDAIEAETIFFHVPAPIVHINFDKVNTAEGVEH